jgi:hypothetical protein
MSVPATQLDDGAVATDPRPVPAPAGRAPPARSAASPATGTPSQAAPARKPQPEPAKKTRRLLTPTAIFTVVTTVLLILGWYLPTDRYITPKRGVGYWLGIVGGSMMLLLFLYSARKRFSWLNFLGPTVGWFRIHMTLGVLGPLCILYHSNFATGASNSNVALYSMLTVAGSGLVGRYIYARIHRGLYGSKESLGELKAGADGLRSLSGSVAFLPELVERLEARERRLLTAPPRTPVLGFAKPMVVALLGLTARWRMHGYIRKALRQAARNSSAVAAQRKRLSRTACAYVDKRLAATRRVAEFQGYERLFSLWHALHIPLIFMLLVAGVVHVIAVHVY